MKPEQEGIDGLNGQPPWCTEADDYQEASGLLEERLHHHFRELATVQVRCT